MIQVGLLLTVLVPLALAAAWPIRRFRGAVGPLAVVAPLPALLLAAVGVEAPLELSWLLFGGRWGLDGTGRVFLGFTATVWLAAGLFTRPSLAGDAARDRFEWFHLLTMSGNFGVIIAQDAGSFLLFFALTSLAAYGLITHTREPASFAAGRTYMILVILGEIVLFWGVLLAVDQSGTFRLDKLPSGVAASPLRNSIAGLVLVGFGIKMGVMPLHIWLPLAHPAAPTPGSAVLSGAIIKTGLLGWLRFLPLGEVGLPEWGAVCVVAGVATAFFAVLIGLTQSHPKTVLAYSSVSQMGLITVGIGTALLAPAAWKTISAAMLLYAAHHALTKGALFLGVGVAAARPVHLWQRRLVMAGLIVSGLSLAGLPLTTGYVAKAALKDTAASAPEAWAEGLHLILPASGVMTALLVSRFLWLVWPGRSESHGSLTAGLLLPWAALTACGILLVFVWRWQQNINPAWLSFAPHSLWSALWPILLAGGILGLLRFRPVGAAHPGWASRLTRIQIPAGDLVVPLTAVVVWGRRVGNAWAVVPLRAAASRRRLGTRRLFRPHSQRHLERISRAMESDLSAGLWLALLAALMLALLR